MSDNIPLPQGMGTLLAAQDVNGVHVLRAKVQIGGFTAEDVSSDNPLPVTGSLAVSSLPGVTMSDSLPPGSNTIGAVSLVPTATGGLDLSRTLGLGTTGVNIKSGAGQVFGWQISCTGPTSVYVKLYDLASAPTVGTHTPVMTIWVPGGSSIGSHHAHGISFSNGIGIGATTGIADADTGAPTANSVIANILYK